MLNRQEILEEINKTKEHLANLQEKLKECQYERWKPQDGEIYFYVLSDGMVGQDSWNRPFAIDEGQRYNFYNCFKTREQAEAEAEKILIRRKLEDIARRLNKGERIDWNNFDQNKYFISFNCATQLIERGFYNLKNKVQGVVYCLSDDFVSVAIQEIGEERLKRYMLGVYNDR